ncbi:hypothetical protein J6590_105961, partial [Homalodisca vitripennis]
RLPWATCNPSVTVTSAFNLIWQDHRVVFVRLTSLEKPQSAPPWGQIWRGCEQGVGGGGGNLPILHSSATKRSPGGQLDRQSLA